MPIVLNTPGESSAGLSSPGGSVGSPGDTIAISNGQLNVIRRDEFYLSDYGLFGDQSTDNALNFYQVLSTLCTNNGAKVVLPRGTMDGSKAFVIPCYANVQGTGIFYYGGGFQLMNGTAADAVVFRSAPQSVTITVSGATGGTFTLTWNGVTTAPIEYNATATQVADALLAITSAGGENPVSLSVTAGMGVGGVRNGMVTGATGTGPWTLTLVASQSTMTLTANGSGLTGGTVSAGSLTNVGPNAFFNTLRDVFINANGHSAPLGSWYSCIDIRDNPYLTAGAHDPNFDPQHRITNVWGQRGSGEGVFCHSRSEIVFESVWMYSCSGTAFFAPFDTMFTDCKADSAGLGGFYIPHSDTQLTGCHSYNHGWTNQFNSIAVVQNSTTSYTLSYNDGIEGGTYTLTVPEGTTSALAWNATGSQIVTALEAISGFVGTVSASPSGSALAYNQAITLTFSNAKASMSATQTQSFSQGQNIVYNGAVYIAANALTNYSGNPYSDSTNWIAPQRPYYTENSVSARGSVNACPEWGYAYYIDGGGGTTQLASCATTEPSAGGLYIYEAGGVVADLTIGSGNWDQTHAGLKAANPHNYAGVVLDGCSGAQIRLSIVACNSAFYALRIINGATGNEVHITTDGSCSVLSPDSVALAGSGNKVYVNGVDISAAHKVNTQAVGATYTVPGPTVSPYADWHALNLSEAGAVITTPPPYVGLDFWVAVSQGATGGYSYSWKDSTGDTAPSGSSTTNANQVDVYHFQCFDGANVLGTLVSTFTI